MPPRARTSMGLTRSSSLRHWIGEGDVVKVAGLNFLRVWDAVHARASAK